MPNVATNDPTPVTNRADEASATTFLPCPFCGADKPQTGYTGAEWHIWCSMCSARIRRAKYEDALAAWNHRARFVPDEAILERAAEALYLEAGKSMWMAPESRPPEWSSMNHRARKPWRKQAHAVLLTGLEVPLRKSPDAAIPAQSRAKAIEDCAAWHDEAAQTCRDWLRVNEGKAETARAEQYMKQTLRHHVESAEALRSLAKAR